MQEDAGGLPLVDFEASGRRKRKPSQAAMAAETSQPGHHRSSMAGPRASSGHPVVTCAARVQRSVCQVLEPVGVQGLAGVLEEQPHCNVCVWVGCVWVGGCVGGVGGSRAAGQEQQAG